MASLVEHGIWPTLAPFLFVEYVGRDPRLEDVPRFRIEVRSWAPSRFLGVIAPCVACGRQMHPIRARAGGSCMYLAATCEDGLSGSCSKGAAARAEYRRIHDALQGVVPDNNGQPSLFE